jgi:hypothetical protein
MGEGWQIVAFPVILPWREEFWTLPLYFPDLKLGVAPGWPSELPYRGMPLPPEAEAQPHELKHYKPGELRQWQAFGNYRNVLEEGDLIQAIRGYGEMPAQETPISPEAWSLVWQLEKMQADQEAQLLLVDRGQEWLREILKPEPWEERITFGPVPQVAEMVDPDLARMRYLLWRRVMAPHLENKWAPFLLGRSSRALFLTLKGWPEWTNLKKVQVSLPACRSAAEWLAVQGEARPEQWLEKFRDLLTASLAAADDPQALEAAARELGDFVEDKVAARWPFPPDSSWDLEIWARESTPAEEGPVLCWAGAGGGILPG